MRTALVLMMACAAWLTAQPPETFKARLSSVPVEAKTRDSIAGIGSASATLAGAKLTISGTFEGLRSPAATAQIHQGPATGVRGPAILDLTIAHSSSGALNASIDLTPQQIESLKKGRLYIQIDSEKAPDGNLWGWLLR